VLTGFPNHPTGKVPPEYRRKLWRLVMSEDHEGVRICRTWLFPLPNRKAWERMVNYSSFSFSAILRGLFLFQPDVVIATSPQLLVGLSGLIIAKCKRAPFIFEVRDLWPESLEAVGVSGKKSALVRVLAKVAGLLYRHADHIVVVTKAFKRHLEREWAVPSEKISVVMNGVDHRLFEPQYASAPIIQEFGLAGRFVVAYIGTIGNAHGLETLIEAAEILKDRDPEILFLLMGDGAAKESLDRELSRRALNNIRIFPAQPRAKVVSVIAACDVCLVLLRKSEVFKTVIPTKLLEFMACERPVLLAVEGEAAEVVKRAGAGICIPPEDAAALAESVLTLKKAPQLRQMYGRQGRAFIERELTREQTAKSYLAVLNTIVKMTG